MKSKYLVLSTGFAMFSMFFGSGNLVFPLLIGTETSSHWLAAALGLLLTGVLVPFLGLLGVLLYDGCTKLFFGSLGKQASFWVPLICLSLMGPFGVLARCITVAHGSVRLLFPEFGLIPFSLIFCSVIFALSLRKNKIVPVLGSILTPLLLLSLAAIAYYGLFNANWNLPEVATAANSLKTGLFKGYQLMDLLAAFFFSAFIISHLKEYVPQNEPLKLVKAFMQSALVGVGLLSTVYVTLVALGALYSDALVNVPPEEMLGTIAQLTMGENAGIVVCVAVALACFTTGVVLAALYADFLQKEVFRKKTSHFMSMGITLLIAFMISTLEFSGIAAFIAPILEAMYPALIVLTVICIAHKTFGMRHARWPVAVALTGKVLLF